MCKIHKVIWVTVNKLCYCLFFIGEGKKKIICGYKEMLQLGN